MAAIPVPPSMSLDEFIAWEESAVEKHEFVNGRILAMAGAGANHIEISAALAFTCINTLRGRPCRFLGENAKVVVTTANASFYPDGVIACPVIYSNRQAGILENPRVIFEILSPSTKGYDYSTKFDAYRKLLSVQDIVYIDSQEQRVEIRSRQEDGSWNLQIFLPGSIAHLPSVDLDLPLDELYENAVFEPAEGV